MRQKTSERPDRTGPLGHRVAFDFILSVTEGHERVLSRELTRPVVRRWLLLLAGEPEGRAGRGLEGFPS